MDIWAACREVAKPGPIAGNLVRVVESQEQIATRGLVDNLNEQALLEDLLETSKPQAVLGAGRLHYLLATPFRYPPLHCGSRFGTRGEPSLFYASLGIGPALAETAYYRLVFWSGMVEPPPGGRLSTEHTVFGARYGTERGLRLHQPPFDCYEGLLTHPADYRATQILGAELRAAGIEGIEYRSARDCQQGINVALFTPSALADRGPRWQQAWLCDTRADRVEFYGQGGGLYCFDRQGYLVDGVLPIPAA